MKTKFIFDWISISALVIVAVVMTFVLKLELRFARREQACHNFCEKVIEGKKWKIKESRLTRYMCTCYGESDDDYFTSAWRREDVGIK